MKSWRVKGDPSEAILDELAAVLRTGGVALFPTDTVYGLHALASDPAAIARISAIKGRAEEKRYVIIASSIEQLRTLGATVPETLNDVWPAPLTAILAAGATTIAARIPDLRWLRALLQRTGPLVSTSANRSGEPPITTPEELGSLLDGLDAVLDQGWRQGESSTIVDFTGAVPRLVREGEKGFAQILRKSLWKGL
jgi:L-threonylcarbamoyladenylate synthase